MKLRHLFLSFLAAFSRPNRQTAEKEPEKKVQKEKGWKIEVSDTKEIRLAAAKEWVKPENVAERLKKLESEAPIALEKGLAAASTFKELMGVPDDIPIPAELPPEMMGQSPSTIKAMLRQEAGWKVDKTTGKYVSELPKGNGL